MKIASILARLAVALCCGFAALSAVRLAMAETLFRQDSPQSITRALNVQGDIRSAAFEERLPEIDPANARGALEAAIALDPRASAAWIDLGLEAERLGDFPRAEQCLLEAARVDRQRMPAWTLTNFYFRRADSEAFWRWANVAANLTSDDFRPLLTLCDRFEQDPDRLVARFASASAIRLPYLRFLIGANRLDAAQRVARAMIGDHANDPYLIDFADRQLRAGNADAALELWNASSGFPPLDSRAGRFLFNGDLRRAPLNLGFDWRLGQASGATPMWKPSELVLRLSGSQPETCILLSQTLYLPPGRFRLRYDYLTGEPPPTGIRWSLNAGEGPEIAPSGDWKEGTFELPRTPGLAELKLMYRRELGTVRTEGKIELRNLRLEASSFPKT